MKSMRLFYSLVGGSFALATGFHYFTDNEVLRFITASIAIIFLASWLGKATENVAHYAGDRIGGFLNATFGNAAELIIAFFLVREGLFEMVKASITGSVIGNLLLVLGLSVLLGGLKFKEQIFNSQLAGHNASMMTLALVSLFIPAIFMSELSLEKINTLSIVIAILLILAYALWLIFSMVTHKSFLTDVEQHESEAVWSKPVSIIMLVVSTFFVAVVSEWLVHSVEAVSHTFGWSELFVGAFVIAIIGNAAEHSAAILLAMKGRIGAAVEIAVGSSLQVALFVAPTLVLISLLFGSPMNIVFTVPELTAIAVSTIITISICRDGKTNWFEGVLLLIVYLILGTAFFFD
ncbi:calcium/proton exchanger [Brevibacillus laterosporus]|uniref:calcium/proton exchanger n=1 Tax=Brevibacillus laterosporus TaxID=1465 RepID=UPI0003714B0E|nr:calcium/proton exchanger [Brevibacillus laterosporus]ATO50856.1 calcium/proton exchanger [Brevibacillus laterosporus DSM 25]AYB38934.1 calcium/proton exchanger [Brevibacillus laterosporus]MBG9774389.1 cation transporter [Brevibacillus laterosporus]MBG9804519.1 cation transporter [Brevibacillus laterosporus]MBM7109598.1 putative cation exchanger YfkE [Brevibacillus laterosporus]